LSFSTWAAAFFTLASASRASSENISSPALTFWPSRMWTFVTVLVTCGRKSTVCSAVTVPFATMRTGTSRDSERVVTTSVVDARPAPFASWLREVPKYHQPASAAPMMAAPAIQGQRR
jgi:hypothetical protein